MKIILFLTAILFFSFSLKAADSKSNQDFLSLEDLALFGAKSIECNNYTQALIAKEILREYLNDTKFNDDLTDERFEILQSFVKKQWENVDVSNIACKDAEENITTALQYNQRIKKNDFVFKDLNKFLKLKSSKRFFGIQLQDDINNYQFNKNERSFYHLSFKEHQVDPPLPNPMFSKYYIYRHINLENVDIIKQITAVNVDINKDICFENLIYLTDFYMNSLDANFIAYEFTKNSLSDSFLTYENFMNQIFSLSSYGYLTTMELNNSNEQIEVQCRKHYGIWTNRINIRLIESSEKITNLSKGL